MEKLGLIWMFCYANEESEELKPFFIGVSVNAEGFGGDKAIALIP